MTVSHPPAITIRKQADRIQELAVAHEWAELTHIQEVRELRSALALALDQLEEEKAANHRLSAVIRIMRNAK